VPNPKRQRLSASEREWLADVLAVKSDARLNPPGPHGASEPFEREHGDGDRRMTSPGVPSERPSFSTGLGLGFLVGGPAAFGSIIVQSKAWVACGVNFGPGTGFSVLFLELPGLWAVNAVLFAGCSLPLPMRRGGGVPSVWWRDCCRCSCSPGWCLLTLARLRTSPPPPNWSATSRLRIIPRTSPPPPSRSAPPTSRHGGRPGFRCSHQEAGVGRRPSSAASGWPRTRPAAGTDNSRPQHPRHRSRRLPTWMMKQAP
jgi:hypothetical protein